MNRKLWLIFAIVQLIGVGLALYSSRFEVGATRFREFLWIPATLFLLPGILCGYVANALSVRALDFGGGALFYAIVVLLNAAFWYTVASLVRKRRRVVQA